MLPGAKPAYLFPIGWAIVPETTFNLQKRKTSVFMIGILSFQFTRL
jgi:hypothetical protein